MIESTFPLLKSWESRIENEGGTGDIKIDEDLRSFSADVISRACFGSSYSKGKEIFVRLRALQQAMSKPSLLIIPGLRYAGSTHFYSDLNSCLWLILKNNSSWCAVRMACGEVI